MFGLERREPIQPRNASRPKAQCGSEGASQREVQHCKVTGFVCRQARSHLRQSRIREGRDHAEVGVGGAELETCGQIEHVSLMFKLIDVERLDRKSVV